MHYLHDSKLKIVVKLSDIFQNEIVNRNTQEDVSDCACPTHSMDSSQSDEHAQKIYRIESGRDVIQGGQTNNINITTNVAPTQPSKEVLGSSANQDTENIHKSERSQSESIIFANRIKEIEVLQHHEHWQGIAIDAPTGYGKTTLLDRVAEIYGEREDRWKVVRIDLEEYPTLLPIWRCVAKEVIGKDLAKKDEGDAWVELKTGLANRRNYILLFDNAGKDNDITEKLRDRISRLFNIRNVNIRVVFAGRQLSRAEWGKQGYIHFGLRSFDWLVIQDLLRKKAAIDTYTKDSEYLKLAAYIYQLSGGHPKVIVDLIAWLMEKCWTMDLSDPQEYKRAFKDVDVSNDLGNILTDYNLSSMLRERIGLLCVFRGINLDVLAELQELGELAPELDRFDILQDLCEAGYLTGPKSSDVFYRDSIVRGLILSKMMMEDMDRWQALHIMARDVFQRLLKKSPISLQPVYLVESIYHALQLRRTDWIQEDIRYASEIGRRRALLDTLLGTLKEDVEIRSIVEGIWNTTIEGLFGNMRPNHGSSVVSPELKSELTHPQKTGEDISMEHTLADWLIATLEDLRANLRSVLIERWEVRNTGRGSTPPTFFDDSAEMSKKVGELYPNDAVLTQKLKNYRPLEGEYKPVDRERIETLKTQIDSAQDTINRYEEKLVRPQSQDAQIVLEQQKASYVTMRDRALKELADILAYLL